MFPGAKFRISNRLSQAGNSGGGGLRRPRPPPPAAAAPRTAPCRLTPCSFPWCWWWWGLRRRRRRRPPGDGCVPEQCTMHVRLRGRPRRRHHRRRAGGGLGRGGARASAVVRVDSALSLAGTGQQKRRASLRKTQPTARFNELQFISKIVQAACHGTSRRPNRRQGPRAVMRAQGEGAGARGARVRRIGSTRACTHARTLSIRNPAPPSPPASRDRS